VEYNGQCLEITHLIDLLSADNFTVSSGNLASVELPVIAVLSANVRYAVSSPLSHTWRWALRGFTMF
jgi:hypothetical protein